MSNTRKITARLFPLESEYGVVLATQERQGKTFKGMYTVSQTESRRGVIEDMQIKTKRKYKWFGPTVEQRVKSLKEVELSYRCTTSSTGWQSRSRAFVSPSGYYFGEEARGTYDSATGEWRIGEAYTTLLNVHGHAMFDKQKINESIDYSLYALVTQERDFQQMVVVSQDRTKLYLYDLEASTSGGFTIDYTGHCAPIPQSFGVMPYVADGVGVANTGLQIYDSKNLTAGHKTKIESIAGFAHSDKHYLAFATNHYSWDDVVVGEVKGAHLMNVDYLRTLPEDLEKKKKKPAQLFAAAENTLIAYQPATHKIHAWDVSKRKYGKAFYSMYNSPGPKSIQCIECPHLFNLSISADGRYFTGLQKQQGTDSDVLHCYSVPSFEHHVIALPEKVADCVIGAKGQLYAVSEQYKDEDSDYVEMCSATALGHISDFLPKKEELVVEEKPKGWKGLFHRRSKQEAIEQISEDESSLDDCSAIAKYRG